jgi:hypothetical protein
MNFALAILHFLRFPERFQYESLLPYYNTWNPIEIKADRKGPRSLDDQPTQKDQRSRPARPSDPHSRSSTSLRV